MGSLPLVVLLLIFVAAAALIWVAGIQLSNQTDVLSTRLHLGSALGGLILLAVATNLPEIAIVVSAAASKNIEVAVGNILGGIAIQTVVLVALDAFGVKGSRPLTYRAASLVLVLEALLVVAVLAVVVAGSQLPSSLIALRLTPAPVLLTILWVAGLFLLRRAGHSLPWHESGEAPDNQDRPVATPSTKQSRMRPAEASARLAPRSSSRRPPRSPSWPACSWNAAATRSPVTSVCPVFSSAQPSWPQPPRCPSSPRD